MRGRTKAAGSGSFLAASHTSSALTLDMFMRTHCDRDSHLTYSPSSPSPFLSVSRSPLHMHPHIHGLFQFFLEVCCSLKQCYLISPAQNCDKDLAAGLCMCGLAKAPWHCSLQIHLVQTGQGCRAGVTVHFQAKGTFVYTYSLFSIQACSSLLV